MVDWLLSFSLLDFVKIWMGISILAIATGWYAATIISAHWPDWWERHVAAPHPKKVE